MNKLSAGILIVMTAFCVTGSPAFAEDMEAKLKAAQGYADTFDFRKMIDDMTMQMVHTVPEGYKDRYIEQMTSMDVTWIEELTVKAMAKHYTVEELNALADFYGSELGQSIFRKAPLMMGDVLPEVQTRMIAKTQELLMGE